MNSIVESRGLSIVHSNERRLHFPDITIQSGDRVLLQGPSGSGKTTLLRLIAGLERPDQGIMTVGAKKIAYAFQEPRLIPHLSPVENLTVATGVCQQEAKDTLGQVGLCTVQNQPCQTLSGGEAQRVNLCRSILGKPDLILIDEGSTGLDSEAQAQVAGLFAKTVAVVVVEVTHHPNPPLVVTNPSRTIKLTA